MTSVACKLCGEDFEQSHNTQRYCSDAHTPYKNPLMAWDVWRSMHKRCKDPKTNGYCNYGAKGITVCEEWEDYITFNKDMGNRPSVKHQLDRIDASKGYSKDNCRWLFHSRNIYNKSKTRRILFKDQENSVAGWARELGLAASSLHSRIDNWGIEKALTEPHGPTGPKRD